MGFLEKENKDIFVETPNARAVALFSTASKNVVEIEDFHFELMGISIG